MAIKVPQLSNSGTQAQALPGVRQQGGRSAAEFLDTTEMSMLDSASKAVNSMQQASMSLYAKEVADANKLRTQDAANQLITYDQDAAFSETGWRNQKGAAVFSQQNSKPLPDNVLESRQQRIDDLMKGLGNDEQRQAFQDYASQSGLRLREQLMGHEAEQHRVYKRGVLASGIDTATRNMTLFYNDETQLKTAISSIEQASKDLGYLEHGSEEIGASNAKRHVSSALNQAIEASITQGDHASATRILQQFSPHMDSNDMLKAYKLITDEQEKRTALDVGRNVIGELYPMMDTGDGDRAFNILLGTESGGRQFDKTGAVITSPKGAVGIAQVMPDTAPEAAKLAGLPWDETRYRNDADYNKALGKAYFQKQLADFGGDLTKAYAAYNAGPGATKNALKQAEATGQPWTSFLPAETQAYISKNMKAFASGQGQYQRPTLADAQQSALAQLGESASPSLQKQTLDVVEKHYNDQTKAIKQRQEESTAQAMRYVLENGGKWSDIPATVRGSVPVDDVDKVMNFAKKISAGDPVSTDWALFYRFKSDDKLLKDTNLMAFRDKLDDGEFKELVNRQQTLNSGDETQLTNLRTPKQILDGFMVQAGIDPTPKEDDKTGSATVGKIWNAYETKVREAEQDKGKKLTSEELQKVAAQLFTQVGVKGLLYGTNEKPKVLLEEGDKITIPSSERQAIIEAWKAARPDRAITEDDIMTMYARNKGLL
jgi:soluble lytic murein transglycosylase